MTPDAHVRRHLAQHRTTIDITTVKVFLTPSDAGLFALCAPESPVDADIITARARAARARAAGIGVPVRRHRHRFGHRRADARRARAEHRHRRAHLDRRAERARDPQGDRHPRSPRAHEPDPALRRQPVRRPRRSAGGRDRGDRRHVGRRVDPELTAGADLGQPGNARRRQRPPLRSRRRDLSTHRVASRRRRRRPRSRSRSWRKNKEEQR